LKLFKCPAEGIYRYSRKLNRHARVAVNLFGEMNCVKRNFLLWRKYGADIGTLLLSSSLPATCRIQLPDLIL
jgi:hypothetical protein